MAMEVVCIVDYETKRNALFIEVVVLVNGESDPEMYKDSQDDYWTGEEIGVIFTSEANQTKHDLYHNKKRVDGVQTIANYRNKTVENIGGREVPVNSWRKDLMVTDDEVIELIKSQEINGVSINNGLKQCPVCVSELKNIKGNIFYNCDIENKECMDPLFTSLVPDPSNGYGMEVYSYDKFLAKCSDPNKVVEMIKSKSSGGDKLNEELKNIFKDFGESVISFANGLEKKEDEENNEEITEEVEKPNTENKTNETDIGMEKADERTEEKTDDKPITLESIKSVVNEAVKPLADKIDTIESEIAEIKGEDDPGESDSENTETTPESQKSEQPKIRLRNEKLESKDMKKQDEIKKNHLGMAVKSTKELAKVRNKFNF